MNAPQALQLPAVGAPFQGGIFAGRFFVDDQPYALIVAPKAEGELDDIAWSEKWDRVDGALSYYDGLANTDAMAAAGSALAAKIRALRIGDFDDWYLPSRGEALLAKAAAMPEGEAFEQAWYWTSTQCAAGSDFAWFQSFSYGGQNYWHKGDESMARAVRRFAI